MNYSRYKYQINNKLSSFMTTYPKMKVWVRVPEVQALTQVRWRRGDILQVVVARTIVNRGLTVAVAVPVTSIAHPVTCTRETVRLTPLSISHSPSLSFFPSLSRGFPSLSVLLLLCIFFILALWFWNQTWTTLTDSPVSFARASRTCEGRKGLGRAILIEFAHHHYQTKKNLR